jgi:hypothetical protein
MLILRKNSHIVQTYQLSHWEWDSFFRELDVLVVGSGIVGLSAAITSKKALRTYAYWFSTVGPYRSVRVPAMPVLPVLAASASWRTIYLTARVEKSCSSLRPAIGGYNGYVAATAMRLLATSRWAGTSFSARKTSRSLRSAVRPSPGRLESGPRCHHRHGPQTYVTGR